MSDLAARKLTGSTITEHYNQEGSTMSRSKRIRRLPQVGLIDRKLLVVTAPRGYSVMMMKLVLRSKLLMDYPETYGYNTPNPVRLKFMRRVVYVYVRDGINPHALRSSLLHEARQSANNRELLCFAGYLLRHARLTVRLGAVRALVFK